MQYDLASPILAGLLVVLLAGIPAKAGSIFLTGHDPDFHAVSGNPTGAQHIIQDAVSYIMDPSFNPFVAAGNKNILFVECDTCSVPAGHLDGKLGMNASASGFPTGTTFETHGDADGLVTELAKLGTKYSAIVIGSDFGGMLTEAELADLNADSVGILNFLNNGGGLFAMAETTPAESGLATGPYFGFLPFIVATSPVGEFEAGNTLTALGTSIGLTNSDINGNFSHNVFTSTGGLGIVDTDPANEILSLAARGEVTPAGIVPEPSSLTMVAISLAAAAFAGFRHHRRTKSADKS